MQDDRQLEALRALHGLYCKALDLATSSHRIGLPDAYDPRDADIRERWRQFDRELTWLRVNLAPLRRQLLESGFDVPIGWLSIRVVGERSSKTEVICGELSRREFYMGVDTEAIRTVCNEMSAWIMKREVGECRPKQEATAVSGRLSVKDLATKHDVPYDALRKRLERWRYDHDAGYSEVANAAKNEPGCLYDELAVMPVIEALRVKSASKKRAADGQ